VYHDPKATVKNTHIPTTNRRDSWAKLAKTDFEKA